MQRRLNGARALLRSRLSRRGIAPTAGALAATLGRSGMIHVPRPGSRRASGRAGRSPRARADRGRRHGVHGGRESGTQVVTYHVIESIERGRGRGRLPDRRARDRLASRAGRTGQGRASSKRPRMQGPRAAPAASPDRGPTSKPAEPGEMIVYQGRVLDPDGKPFAGAAVYLVSYGLKHPDDPPIRATSGADGRFRFDGPEVGFRYLAGTASLDLHADPGPRPGPGVRRGHRRWKLQGMDASPGPRRRPDLGPDHRFAGAARRRGHRDGRVRSDAVGRRARWVPEGPPGAQ